MNTIHFLIASKGLLERWLQPYIIEWCWNDQSNSLRLALSKGSLVLSARIELFVSLTYTFQCLVIHLFCSFFLGGGGEFSLLFCLEGDNYYKKEYQVFDNYTKFMPSFIKETTLFTMLNSFSVDFKDMIAMHESFLLCLCYYKI